MGVRRKNYCGPQPRGLHLRAAFACNGVEVPPAALDDFRGYNKNSSHSFCLEFLRVSVSPWWMFANCYLLITPPPQQLKTPTRSSERRPLFLTLQDAGDE